MSVLLGIVLVVLTFGAALAGEAVVERVEASETSPGVWRFDVTVRHADEGWDHYANAFTISTPEGELLGTRTLHHPHVEEQPFTRSLTGVEIGADVEAVEVRAVDSVHGEGAPVTLTLPR